jgi:hypothetical protein
VNKIERLIRNYERQVSLTWDDSLAGAQRVWFAVYDKQDERRLRASVDEFGLATRRAGKKWVLQDLTHAFAQWMSAKEYRESYFEVPEDLELTMDDLLASVAEQVSRTFATKADQQTVVALLGVACLFGFVRVSALVQALQSHIPGRLLVFFPGEYDQNTYRLLDARDGWNYLAVPIIAQDKTQQP